MSTSKLLPSILLLLASAVGLQAQVYLGILGGVATLSGDNHAAVGTNSSFSSYDPKNGPAVEFVVGKDLSDYFTIQGEYIWNRNTLILTSAQFSNGMQAGYSETRNSSQQSFIGDLLIYFRKRNSRFRPFLSVGTGFMHLASSAQEVDTVIGDPILPPQHFSSNQAVLHVPVGLDVKLKDGLDFRYSFSETLSGNPISKQLSPPATHNLQNFQNLWGIVYRF